MYAIILFNVGNKFLDYFTYEIENMQINLLKQIFGLFWPIFVFPGCGLKNAFSDQQCKK